MTKRGARKKHYKLTTLRKEGDKEKARIICRLFKHMTMKFGELK